MGDIRSSKESSFGRGNPTDVTKGLYPDSPSPTLSFPGWTIVRQRPLHLDAVENGHFSLSRRCLRSLGRTWQFFLNNLPISGMRTLLSNIALQESAGFQRLKFHTGILDLVGVGFCRGRGKVLISFFYLCTSNFFQPRL